MSKAIVIIYILLFSFSCLKTNSNTLKPVNTTPKKPANIFETPLGAWTNMLLTWDESSERSAISYDDLTDLLAKNHVKSDDFDKELNSFINSLSKSSIISENSWLNQKKPDSFNKEKLGRSNDETFFAQKTHFPKDSDIVVIGDLHGSLHSLVRNLWRLVKLGYLDPNLKIVKKNAYLVFTGDFVDRGRYSIECLYTLMKLKSANMDKVFLIRGNHENNGTSARYGLKTELNLKYGVGLGGRLFTDIINFYQLLPVVLLAEVKAQEKTILHFSHGGFGYDTEKEQLLHSPKELLNNNANFELLSSHQAQPYMWADFYQHEKSTNSKRSFKPSDGVSTLGRIALEQYSQEMLAHTKKPLAGIFRGHQDQIFGFKMLFKDMPDAQKMADLKENNNYYKEGPFDWHDVVLPEEKNNAETSGLDLSHYRPVFTFTTAAEGQGVDFDTLAILKIKDLQKDYRLLIYEIPLTSRPERSYVTIDKTSAADDVILSSWDEKGPGKLIWQ